MTIQEESLVLLDCLRHFDARGERCRRGACGVFSHRLEACVHDAVLWMLVDKRP